MEATDTHTRLYFSSSNDMHFPLEGELQVKSILENVILLLRLKVWVIVVTAFAFDQ
jgi:hypothetical protein